MVNQQLVMVMLDALLDTRVAIAIQAGAEEINWEGYYSRIHSKVWEYFGMKESDFKRAYAARNADTLDYARATNLAFNLNYILGNKAVAAMGNPLLSNPEVLINTFPYRLSDAACKNIADALDALRDPELQYTIKCVYNPVRKLTPAYLKQHSMDLILYDLTEWFEYHNSGFNDVKMPDITIAYPATLNHEDISKFHMDEAGEDPFQTIRTMLSPVVNLRGVNPDLLSLNPALLSQSDPHE